MGKTRRNQSAFIKMFTFFYNYYCFVQHNLLRSDTQNNRISRTHFLLWKGEYYDINLPSVCRVRWHVPPTPLLGPLTARRRSGCSRASHTAGRTTTGPDAWACAQPSCDRASSSPAVVRGDAALAPAPAVSESRSATHGYTHTHHYWLQH